jgi:hypothetical protein
MASAARPSRTASSRRSSRFRRCWGLRLAGVSVEPTLPALIRPTMGAAITAAVIMLIDSVVSGNSFVQLLLAAGASLIVDVLVVVPSDQFRQLKTLRAHFR